MKKEVSSGTQKAENLTRQNSPKKTTVKKSTGVKSADKTTAKKNTAKKPVQSKNKVKKTTKKDVNEKRLQRKQAHEEKRIAAMKIRAEKKQKRLEKKLEAKQKRLDRIEAAREARRERIEKRRERRDMLRHETKTERIDRKREERRLKVEARVAKREAALADKRAKREHRLKVRADKRAERNDKRHAPGFGGWLAAVISLGVTTLALGTMLTFGWLNMNGMQANMASYNTESVYELNSIVDNLDTNLAKARVSNSKNEQVRLLTDIAIESEMAEVIIERLPLETQTTQNLTSFVNKMGDSAQSMLFAVANGKELSESQVATIEHMYRTNLELKKMLNEMCANCTEKDMINMMNGKTDSLIYSSFDNIQNTTIETPKEIHDGPFAENIEKVTAKNLEGLTEITASRAEELAKEYFKDYKVDSVKCTGETVAEQLTVYNLSLMTKDGEMSCQLSKKGGKVVEFNSYKDCADKNFSVERCIDIAEDFLDELGFDDMKAVWTSENGTTCNLNFVYEDDDVVFYSDMIKVKVCEERGIVTGMEGLSYVLNHVEREAPSPSISKNEAKAKLNSGFEIESSRLCVIPVNGEEVLCYEFCGTYDNGTYYIYVDAKTGEEAEVFTVIGTKQGKALM